MRARLHDPQGPWWSRAVLPSIGFACMALTVYWYVNWQESMNVAFFIGLVIVLVSPLILGRNRPRTVDVALSPGRVRIRRGGLLNQTFRAKSVLGASTARSERGISLALMRRGRASPLLFELEDDAQAHAVCDALGVGRGGFGVLAWERDCRPVDRAGMTARVVVALAWLAYGVVLQTAMELPPSTEVLGVLLGILTVVTIFAPALDASRRSYIQIGPDGVAILWPRWELVPYSTIVDADATAAGIDIVVEREDGSHRTISVPVATLSHLRRGMTRAEVDHVVAQIQSASKRAHGHVEVAPDVAARIEVLRRAGDGARAWLARLDALADRAKASQVGYRDTAVVAREDLVAALEDHDCDPELRAAAARVLVRIDPAVGVEKVRAAIETVHDEHDARRLRIALEPDMDDAVAELESLRVMR